MSEVWVGIQDYADSAPKWLDASVSFSWLRALEASSSSIECIAFVREINYTRDMVTPIRGVSYRFRKAQFPNWAAEIPAIAPALILYNLCEYNIGAGAMQFLHYNLPNTTHVIRLHHEVKFLMAHEGFRECVLEADIAIVPTESQVDDLREIGFHGEIRVIPFGVDRRIMERSRRPWGGRDIDFVCANTAAPQKNAVLLQKVFTILISKGYRTENAGGLTPSGLAEKLGRSKIFFQPSMTEASGSRVLLEGIAAGCYPIALTESKTTSEVALQHGGQSIESGISFDFSTRKVFNPSGIEEVLAERLVSALVSLKSDERSDLSLLPEYDEAHEIGCLVRIMRDHKGKKNWRDRPLVRAAASMLESIGESAKELTAEGVVASAKRVSKIERNQTEVAKAATAICTSVGFSAGIPGLASKIFTERFDFISEVSWLISEARSAAARK